MDQIDCEVRVPVRMQFIAEMIPIRSLSLVQVQSPYSMNGFSLQRANEATVILVQLHACKRTGRNAALHQVEMQVEAAVVLDILGRAKEWRVRSVLDK